MKTVNPKLITPVVTVFNKSRKEIMECIESLTRFPFFEIIVVNDKSTNPETLETISELVRMNDIRVINLDNNAGPSVAFATGVRIARSKYILKMDGDDKLLDLHRIPDNIDDFDVCLTLVDKEVYRPKDGRVPLTHEGVLFSPCPYIAGAIIKTDIAKVVFKKYKFRLLDDIIGYLRILDHTKNIIVSENTVYQYNFSPTSFSVKEVIGEPGFADFNIMMAFFSYLYEKEDKKNITKEDMMLLYGKNKFVFQSMALAFGYNKL